MLIIFLKLEKIKKKKKQKEDISPGTRKPSALFHVSICCFPLATSRLVETCKTSLSFLTPMRSHPQAALAPAVPTTFTRLDPVERVHTITENLKK
jgi:hypothetical protein